jgi:hypothetical protein
MLRRGVAWAAATAVVVGMLVAAGPASAYWHSGGTGVGSATVGTLAPPTEVTAVSSQPGTVTVAWAASGGALTPEGYYVERFAADGTHPACGTSPTSMLAGLSCDDAGLSDGTYDYRVVAVYRSWSARSASSAPVVLITSLLGSAAAFSVLGTAVTTTGFTRVSGDLGTTPGADVVGFPDGVVEGEIHAGDATAALAELDRAAAFADLSSRTEDYLLSGDLIGQTLAPGVYYAGAALGLTGILTLDGGGDPDALFIIRVDAAISTAAASSVVLIDGARAANVYWVVDAAVTTGALSSFSGTIIAQGAITLGAGGQLAGRALSRDAVTMADNLVTAAT